MTCNRIAAYDKIMDNMDIVFKALADSNRRMLLDKLYRKNGQTLNELCEQMAMTRQSVTKHLLILEEADLVVVEWKGRYKYHYLNVAPIGEIYDRWVKKYERQRIEALQALKKTLEDEVQ